MARRLPIYLLLDVSSSMSGEPIAAVQNGVQTMVAALMDEPQALATAYLSVITFSDSAEQLVPLTEVMRFKLPPLKAGGQPCLGEALKLVAKCAEREVVKNTESEKGDWRPLVFILTDGCAAGDIDQGLAEFKKRKWGSVVVCVAGSGADTDEFSKITENVVTRDTATSSMLAACFRWISSTVATGSRSAGDEDMDLLTIELPPPPPEIQFF